MQEYFIYNTNPSRFISRNKGKFRLGKERKYSPDFSSTMEAIPATKETALVSPTSNSTLHMFSRLFLILVGHVESVWE